MRLLAGAAGLGPDFGQAVIYAAGAIATLIGAASVRARRGRPVPTEDFEDTPARMRERLTALETHDHEQDRRLDEHDEEMRLLRAIQVADESHRPRRRT